MGDEYKLTEAGQAAVHEICIAVRDVVATRPNGFPAGELYALTMETVQTLRGFETLMAVTVKLGLVEKRGQLYFAREP